MKTTLLYDHFVALGGAEKVSLEIAASLTDCTIETAFADEKLFAQPLKKQELKQFSFRYFDHIFPTFSLFLFYLLRYKIVGNQVNLLATGVFSPLVLWRHQKIKNTVVYFHTFPSFVNTSFKHLREAHGLLGALIFRIFTRLYLWFLHRSLKRTKNVFANSLSVKQRFASIGIKTKVFYPGVKLNDLSRENSEGYFLSTARLEPNKRVELVLMAFAQLKNYDLQVVGGGSLLESLKERYIDCENIHFLGWQEPQQIIERYNKCQALVYVPENEYFGIAPIEANAAGKPVIGAAEGGLLETIDDIRLGVLLDTPIDIDILKQAISNYAENEDSEEVIRFRQKSAQRFDFETFIDRIKILLN